MYPLRVGDLSRRNRGELWDLAEDPLQRINLWDDTSRKSLRDDLLADLADALPPRPSNRLRVESPV